MNFRPLGDIIVVQREALPDRTPGGLFLYGREWPAYGYVLAVGPGRRTKRGGRRPLDLQRGDEVAFDKWSVENRLIPGTTDCFAIDYDRCYLRIRHTEPT